jgi:glycosyltransferase involved in cell wall biosynthesis
MTNKFDVGIVSFEFSPFPGGHGTYATEMAAALVREGLTVSVIAPQYPDIEAGEENDNYTITRAFSHQKLDLKSLLATSTWLKEARPRIVLACDIRSGLAMLAARFGHSTRLVTMYHGSEILKASTSVSARLVNAVVAWSSNAIVANSQYTATLVKRYTGRKCATALLGISDYWITPADDLWDSTFLRDFCARGIPVASTVARLEPRKGHLAAIAAIKALRQRGAPIRYVIAGKIIDDDYGEKVLTAAKSLDGDFHYAGVISRGDARRLYAASTVHILAARTEPLTIEGFGLSTLEAAGQGCPSVVTNAGGLPEAVIDGKSGIVVHEQDNSALIEALDHILSNTGSSAAMRSSARTHATSSTWRQTVLSTPLIRTLVT